MPLDFPSSPANGQVYQNYYYDGPTGAWRSLSSTVNPIPSTLKNLTISSTETTGVSLKVTPFTTSSVNLQEWYNTSSTVVASMNVAGDLTANELNLTGTEINGDSKTIARYSDTWLRLNPDGDFSGGIYTNTSLIRTDNGLQVGANGANFLATSSALTHNGTDILKKDMRQYYPVGNVGTGTAANYYEIFTWTISGQYNNFSAEIKVNGRGNTDAAYTVHARGEYGVSTWSTEILNVYSESALADGDTWLLVFNDAAKTAKLYYRRSGNDWNDRSINFLAHWLGGATPAYSNTNFGTTAPTGDAVITKTAPDAISVVAGGTGTTTLTSGGYLKGAGTGAITSQTGIPAGDITSGTLDMARLPSGTIIQQVHYTYNTYVSGTGTAWTDIHSGTRPAITAKRSDSHFIILASMNWLQEGTRRQMIQLLRNGTVVAPNDIMIATSIASGWTQAQMFYQWKDTSARTAGTTYTFSFNTAVTAGTWYYNYNYGGITGTSMYSILEIVA